MREPRIRESNALLTLGDGGPDSILLSRELGALGPELAPVAMMQVGERSLEGRLVAFAPMLSPRCAAGVSTLCTA